MPGKIVRKFFCVDNDVNKLPLLLWKLMLLVEVCAVKKYTLQKSIYVNVSVSITNPLTIMESMKQCKPYK